MISEFRKEDTEFGTILTPLDRQVEGICFVSGKNE